MLSWARRVGHREEAEPERSSQLELQSERHAQQHTNERREEGAFSRLDHGVRALASRLSNLLQCGAM